MEKFSRGITEHEKTEGEARARGGEVLSKQEFVTCKGKSELSEVGEQKLTLNSPNITQSKEKKRDTRAS